MIGGFDTFNAICETFEAAIAEANRYNTMRDPFTGLPLPKGHVYITGLQLNALRDLSQNQKWGGEPWDPKATVDKDQTVLGFVLRMMAAGIDVRLLLWMPTTVQKNKPAPFEALAAEHWSIAAAVQDFDNQLSSPHPPGPGVGGRGIVALDLRTAGPTGAALHQKLIVVRVGAVNVAYCGGIDLAFSRRDFGRSFNKPHGFGDWQSGDTTPRPKDGWPKQKDLGGDRGAGYPKSYPVWDPGRFPEDLPANVYGKGHRFWHDQHLELKGPIVATLEQQFVERWVLDSRVFKFDRTLLSGVIIRCRSRIPARMGACTRFRQLLPSRQPAMPRSRCGGPFLSARTSRRDPSNAGSSRSWPGSRRPSRRQAS